MAGLLLPSGSFWGNRKEEPVHFEDPPATKAFMTSPSFGTSSIYDGKQLRKGLLDLPVDIIRLLVTHIAAISPTGFESFMLTCKSFYTIGGFCLKEHQVLKETYRDCRDLNWHGRGFITPQLAGLHFLIRLAKDRRRALYIESISLNTNDVHNGPFAREGLIRHIPDNDEVSLVLQSLLEDNKYLKDAGQDIALWSSALRKDEGHYAAVLILTLLPYVRRICLPLDWDDMRPHYHGEQRSGCNVWPVLKLLAQRANTREHAALAKLENLEPFEERRDKIYYLQDVFPFIAVDSMKSWAGQYLYTSDYDRRPSDLVFDMYSANMTDVVLTKCVIDGGEVYALTSRFPSLRSFTYKHAVFDADLGYDWNGQHFMDELARGCGDRLEVLDIGSSVACWWSDDEDAEARNSRSQGIINSLDGFVKLRSLALDVQLFSAPIYTHRIGGQTPACTRKLVDMLPETLEKLVVRMVLTEIETEMLSKLLDGWLEGKHRLGRLEKATIVFESSSFPKRSLMDALSEKAGRAGFIIDRE